MGPATGHALSGRGTYHLTFNHFRPEIDARGLNVHKDSGWVTVLRSLDPGLEVQRDGRWEPIDPEPGWFIVNFGCAMEILHETRPHRWPPCPTGSADRLPTGAVPRPTGSPTPSSSTAASMRASAPAFSATNRHRSGPGGKARGLPLRDRAQHLRARRGRPVLTPSTGARFARAGLRRVGVLDLRVHQACPAFRRPAAAFSAAGPAASRSPTARPEQSDSTSPAPFQRSAWLRDQPRRCRARKTTQRGTTQQSVSSGPLTDCHVANKHGCVRIWERSHGSVTRTSPRGAQT